MNKELIIDSWFPTTIGVCDYPEYANSKDKWIDYILSKPTRNGWGGDDYQPHEDEEVFGDLNNWIESKVNEYAKKHKFVYNYEAKESWFIDYMPYDFNPWHRHNGYTISTIFYLKGRPKEMQTQFRNPVFEMKNPQGKRVKNDFDDAEFFNEYTYLTCSYDTIPGRLLIFRSHTEHCTTQNTRDNKRIIFSYNFDEKNKYGDI